MEKKNNKIIGVLGGMGPEASAHFYKMLISHAQKDFGVEKNEDFPEIILDSVPIPDFIEEEKREPEALDMLIRRVEMLNALPISYFCMACNTGHILLDTLRTKTSIPFISLLEEFPRYIKTQKIRTVGLLATPTTIKTKLYDKPFREAGIKLIVPRNEDIHLLGKIILDTIAGKNTEQNKIEVQKIARRLLQRGAEGIAESCTEIPLIFPRQHLVPVYDSLEVLALAVLEKYYLLQ